MTTPDKQRIATALAEAAEAGTDLEELVTVELVGDACWQSPALAAGAPLGHHYGRKGETVTMPTRAAIRLAVLGYIAGDEPELEVADALPAGTPAEQLEDLDALTEELDDDDALPAESAHAAAAGLGAFVPTGPDPDLDPDGTDIDTDELLARSAPELVAHLGQFPGDADRIIAAELARGTKARKTVLKAAGHDEDV